MNPGHASAIHGGVEPAAPPDRAARADPDAAALIAFVATRDAPCPVCSYNLRGLSEPRCPECAAPLHLQVGSENLRLGAWFAAALSLALALGFDSVVSVMISVGLAIAPPRSWGQLRPVLTMLGGFLALAAVCGVSVWALYRGRRRFTRQGRRAQRAWAAGIFMAVFLTHALYGAIVTRLL
jgi:hypothetical protein